MRLLIPLALLSGLTSVARPDNPTAMPARRVSDALLEAHESGRVLYNGGDHLGGYRMYQGALIVARKMLADQPDLQKTITDGLAAAERLPTVDRRAFRLHELIETVRIALAKSGRNGAEKLTIPPRETTSPKSEPKRPAKPPATVSEVKGGVVGRVLWKGMPVGSVAVTFVTLGQPVPRVFEATTSTQGVYTAPTLPAGRYVVLITAGPNAAVKDLPARYATSTTSPLVIEVKGGGEKLDFMLQ